jgi:hypothetical protein
MSFPITVIDDYKGSFRIPYNSLAEKKINDYIEQYEEQIVSEWLGNYAVKIYSEQSIEDSYYDLMYGVEWLDTLGNTRSFKGFIYCLKRLFYYNYIKDNWLISPVGVQKNETENAIIVNDNYNKSLIYNAYNEAVRYYNNDLRIFLNYHSKIEANILGYTELGGGQIELEVDTTKYLYDTIEITIGSENYKVVSFIEDETIIIEADSIENDIVSWMPLDLICFKKQKMQWL